MAKYMFPLGGADLDERAGNAALAPRSAAQRRMAD